MVAIFFPFLSSIGICQEHRKTPGPFCTGFPDCRSLRNDQGPLAGAGIAPRSTSFFSYTFLRPRPMKRFSP